MEYVALCMIWMTEKYCSIDRIVYSAGQDTRSVHDLGHHKLRGDKPGEDFPIRKIRPKSERKISNYPRNIRKRGKNEESVPQMI